MTALPPRLKDRRSVPEWIGKHPDAAIPLRVRIRVFEVHDGRCANCTRKIVAGDAWALDHIKALVNGGEHREANLQPLCEWCHKPKTAADVAEKSKVYQKKAKHLGVRKKGRSLPGNRDSDWKQTINNGWVRR